MSATKIISAAGLEHVLENTGTLDVYTPINGSKIASVSETSPDDMKDVIACSQAAFRAWRNVPAPRRGELVRLLGDELRANKEVLGKLVTLECGKIYQEGLGEVQEMIDICDFAVGLSRQLYGLTIHSERPDHKMIEMWHPMGPCGVISAFNFPVAVWAWNAALALVCGDPVIWKPSEKTPLTALACQKIFESALKRFGDAPDDLLQVVVGGREVGEALVASEDVPIISATGSTAMGRKVGPVVAARFGRSILELGGNNAMIVTPSADLDMAVRAIVFSAVGTCGQRCTTLRRLIVHNDIRTELVDRLKKAYDSILIGDPLDQSHLVGPLIDEDAFNQMQKTLETAKSEGGVINGGDRLDQPGAYVHPALVEMPGQTDVVKTETFAPILYIMGYDTLTEAIEMQNGVPQGLSSCIFSTDVRETESFISAIGSDCGIANVNIGPSGAEIGGAFGGEKETGGGRESGSDAWKSYMRRQTNTINYSSELPLAQGIKFDL
ncbi:aldehyde dehydrogenase family protein [Terasakiella sp. A23]|uniref:L-piperidine-6-carboxylate dehydrogenase n=1 Tax=Terasakiella sp. FCG-A23 TaxID=3080561 RepID=UPI002952F6E5|nr:aldehyde dehydrogenase family protein [Terasakiella sp. A23]MDV7338685.1 aldehyde dehydrogenase family protein [Terasakiella sp. A23]